MRYVKETAGMKMIVNNGTLLSIVSEKWLNKYIKEKGVKK